MKMRLSVLALVLNLGICGMSAHFDHSRPSIKAAESHKELKDEIPSDE